MPDSGERLPVPRHIAFIMDGNGRWARQRGLPREAGHREGAKVFENLVDYCGKIGVSCVTVYAFSTENWKRPPGEVRQILSLLRSYIKSAFRSFAEKDVRVIFLGDKSPFPASVRRDMEKLEEVSRGGSRLLGIAMNYGGRAEILAAARSLLSQGLSPEDITEQRFAGALFTAEFPDPDLIVRTAGEMRLSNFLLWQCAYSEFYSTDTLWPDMRPADVDKAIADYRGRTRRFGGLV